jgi:LmbE family N-acetylglucosaminyl deacetylase
MMNFEKLQTVLVLAPHTDDGEFGCGGTISRLISNGVRVIYIAFSAAETSVPIEFESSILRKEVLAATSVLGIADGDCLCLEYQVRHFPTSRQEILENMINFGKEFRPELVLLPSRYDTHQDHATVFQEGFRAFKKTTMLGYEVPWNNLEFHNNCFVRLEEKHVRAKVESLACYKSQSGRPYSTENYIRSLATTRGVQIGENYAECFEIIRSIV